LKIRDFATYNMKMINSFYEHKNIQTYTWSACNCNTVIDYFIANWPYKQRIEQKLQEIPESSNIVVEWTNIKTIISQAVNKGLGKYKAFTKKKKFKTWEMK